MSDGNGVVDLPLTELEQFESGDQETTIKMIDAMIVKRRVEGAVKPIDRQANSG